MRKPSADPVCPSSLTLPSSWNELPFATPKATPDESPLRPHSLLWDLAPVSNNCSLPPAQRWGKRELSCVLVKKRGCLEQIQSLPCAFSSSLMCIAHSKGQVSASILPSIRFLTATWFHVHQQHQEVLNQTPMFWQVKGILVFLGKHNCSDLVQKHFFSPANRYLKHSPLCSVTERKCYYSLQLVCSLLRTTKCATGILYTARRCLEQNEKFCK